MRSIWLHVERRSMDLSHTLDLDHTFVNRPPPLRCHLRSIATGVDVVCRAHASACADNGNEYNIHAGGTSPRRILTLGIDVRFSGCCKVWASKGRRRWFEKRLRRGRTEPDVRASLSGKHVLHAPWSFGLPPRWMGVARARARCFTSSDRAGTPDPERLQPHHHRRLRQRSRVCRGYTRRSRGGRNRYSVWTPVPHVWTQTGARRHQEA